MKTGCADKTAIDPLEKGVSHQYVSCIRIHGKPILPPLMTPEKKDEMQHYKELAELIELKLKSRRKLIKSVVRPISQPEVITEQPNSLEKDTLTKPVDKQEILEEFDPFTTKCSTVNSEAKCRHSGSSDEFSTSKTDSSNVSAAMTNSTDLYHYMDVTNSSFGDGRSTLRSETPPSTADTVTGCDWISPPSNPPVKATYEGLNEYLDSILISSAPTPPSHTSQAENKGYSSDEEATPTNKPADIDIVFTEEAVPLASPINNAISENVGGKLIDEAGEMSQPETENSVPRLVRSNSYTLDSPSPMLLAHLEAEKKRNQTSKVVVGKSSKIKSWGVEKRNALNVPKRTESQAHSPTKKIVSPANLNKNRAVSTPKSAKVATPKKEEVIVHKLIADLQEEHKRQMEHLLLRQKKEQEMIRQALKDSSHTWSEYLRSNPLPTEVQAQPSAIVRRNTSPSLKVSDVTTQLKVTVQTPEDQVISPYSDPQPVMKSASRDFSRVQKSLSSSFLLCQISNNIPRNMTLSAPPGGLELTASTSETCLILQSPEKRPSSSPTLETRRIVLTDTNGNLDGTIMSPRTRRKAWGNCHMTSEDPDWLELSRQRQEHWAASKIQAGVRGYLTRRLLRTERVQGCITVIHDTILCALQLQKECSSSVEPSDLQLHGRLIQQLSDACREIHDIFMDLPVAKRMAIIALDRERLGSRSPRSPRNNAPRPLSRATQIALSRKNSVNNSNTTARRNWANVRSKSCTLESTETIRSAPSSNGDALRAGSGPNSRKPWR